MPDMLLERHAYPTTMNLLYPIRTSFDMNRANNHLNEPAHASPHIIRQRSDEASTLQARVTTLPPFSPSFQ